MAMDKINEWLAGSKPIVTYVLGLGTVLGYQSIGGLTPGEITTDLEHITNGIKEIGTGLAPLAAAAIALWAKYRASMKSKVADVKAAEPAALMQAVQAVSPVTLRDAVAAQPDVLKVQVATSAMAQASPSSKVTT